MQSKDLVKLWNAPDNTRLTPKQKSIRLPLHVAAKISALCEIFPKKTKTDIIGDLLATALDDVEEGLSSEPYPWEEETGPDEVWGDRKKYYDLANKCLKELESETGGLESAEEEKASRKHDDKAGFKAALKSLRHRTAERGARAAKQRRTRTRPGK